VALLFSANQIRGLKSVRQIIEVRYEGPYLGMLLMFVFVYRMKGLLILLFL